MNKSIMIHEFKMMIKSKKNVLFVIALISLILSYCLLILPGKVTPDSFDLEQTKNELKDLEAVQEGKEARGATGFSTMSGRSPYAENAHLYKIQSRLVTAFEDKDFNRFTHFRAMGYGFSSMNLTRDMQLMMSGSPFPGLDSGRYYSMNSLRYQSYLNAGIPITYEMLEQKTALQVLQNFIIGATALMILFCALYFSSDMLAKDRQHQTILQGLPIGWYRLINLKSFVAFFYTIMILAGLALIAFIILSIQNGFGSFKIAVPITLPQEMEEGYFGYQYSTFDTITLGKFLLLALGVMPILVYLFIRLNALLSLLLKNTWLVLMVGSAILFSERIYFSRTMKELFGIEISNLPQTYFDFGKVITGEKYFLVNLTSITYQKGIIVLLISILVLEISLYIVSRVVNKRRFYKAA